MHKTEQIVQHAVKYTSSFRGREKQFFLTFSVWQLFLTTSSTRLLHLLQAAATPERASEGEEARFILLLLLPSSASCIPSAISTTDWAKLAWSRDGSEQPSLPAKWDSTRKGPNSASEPRSTVYRSAAKPKVRDRLRRVVRRLEKYSKLLIEKLGNWTTLKLNYFQEVNLFVALFLIAPATRCPSRRTSRHILRTRGEFFVANSPEALCRPLDSALQFISKSDK